MEMEENITDQISELPGCILHHILSYLDCPKDIVRMSVLSTYWFELTASFPILNFDFRTFKEVIRSSGIPVDTEKDKMDIFLKYVEYTVSRLCEKNLNVHTFNLVTSRPVRSEVDIIDRCLGLILEKGVEVLVINTNAGPYVATPPEMVYSAPPPPQMYRLPNILLSASSLTTMKINHCELPSSLMVDVVRLKSLKVLHLTFVPLSEEMIKRLTTSCSLLEKLVVRYCCGFKKFCVRHLNLQQLKIFGPEIERIEIDAPKLVHLCLDFHGKGVLPSMNLASCKSVTQLCYHGPRKELADLLSSFPVLENLFLELPKKCKKLTLSSHSIRTIMIQTTKCDLRKINVDGPNLLLFGFTDSPFSPCSYFPMEPNSVPSKARMLWNCDAFIQDHWFQNLRQFLDKKIRFKELKLHINVGCLDNIRSEVIQWPPVELTHVELEADYFEDVNYYEFVVKCLLWCCRPQFLTLIINLSLLEFEEWCRVVKYTYEKLLQQEDQVHTSIHFVMASSTSNAKLKFTNLSSLLRALPRDESIQTLSFIKERSCSGNKAG